MIFHICAKGVYRKEGPIQKSLHDNWTPRKMRGFQDLVISSMSYTVCVSGLSRNNEL
jgi:hypothetical protein